MPDVAVHLRYARIAPRKARMVVDLVRGKSVVWAEAHLALLPQKAARFVSKLLKSGVAAAGQKKLSPDRLAIKSVLVQEGPRLKRAVPHFRGTIRPIDKQMSHITLVLTDETSDIGNSTSVKRKKVGNRQVSHV